ncbi:uncharacterized protein [Setaria viridis]
MRAQTGGDGGNGHRFYQHPSPMTVRYVYAVLFLLANILFEGQRRSGCHGDHDCLAAACSYMEPRLVGAYSVFLCFAAITSEPEIDCYKKGKAVVNWKTMIVSALFMLPWFLSTIHTVIFYQIISLIFQHWQSFVFELTSTAASAFSTGSDYKCILESVRYRPPVVTLQDSKRMEDRQWMYTGRTSQNTLTNEWLDKTDAFLERAFASVNGARSTWCPCSKCGNMRRQTKLDMGKHLVKNGFTSDYTRWIYHGESDRGREEVLRQRIEEFDDDAGVGLEPGDTATTHHCTVLDGGSAGPGGRSKEETRGDAGADGGHAAEDGGRKSD